MKTPVLMLTFSSKTSSRLVTSELRLASGQIVRAKSGKENEFTWTPAVQAVCLLFLRYLIESLGKGDPQDFLFSGDRDHPAKSIDELLDQNPEKYHWLRAMFGEPNNTNRTKLHEFINRLNPGLKMPGRPFELKVDTALLPPESVRIFILGAKKQIRETADLQAIANSIRQQWELRPRNTKIRRSDQEKRTAVVLSPNVAGPDLKIAAGPKHLNQVGSVSTSVEETPAVVSSLSKADMVPFVEVESSFLKLEEGPYSAVYPKYRNVQYSAMPRLTPFQSVRSRLVGSRFVVLRGTDQSGRTTLAKQLASDFVSDCRPALYLDLKSDLPPPIPEIVAKSESFFNRECLVIVDNIDKRNEVASKLYQSWQKRGTKSLLLCIETWEPDATLDLGAIGWPPDGYVDLRYSREDFEQVYRFWGGSFLNIEGRFRPRMLRADKCGASLGRFHNALVTHKKASTLKHHILEVYDSGEVAVDITRGFNSITQIPCIREFLDRNPKEQGCLMRIGSLLNRLDGDGLSRCELYAQAFSSLWKHPVHKWHYLLEELSQVIGLLERSQKVFPEILMGYSQALERDASFSKKMASRVLDIEARGGARYLAFADEFLPQSHRSNLLECLFNSGPEIMLKVTGPWRAITVVKVLEMALRYLPSEFASRFLDRWTTSKMREKFERLVAELATTDGSALIQLSKHRCFSRFIAQPRFEEIVASPAKFVLKTVSAFEQKRVVTMGRPREETKRPPFPKRPEHPVLVSLVTSEPTAPPAPLRAVNSWLPIFRQADEDLPLNLKPSYRDIYDLRLPRVGAFEKVLAAVEAKSGPILIRGVKGAGKTTLALQIVLHLEKDGCRPLYLDLAAPDCNQDRMGQVSTWLQSPREFSQIVVINNAHENRDAAEQLCKIGARLPKVCRIILILEWTPVISRHDEIIPGIGTPHVFDLLLDEKDLRKIYFFWNDQVLRHRNAPKAFQRNTYLFFGASLRRMIKALTSERGQLLTTGLLRFYQGQGCKLPVVSDFVHHYTKHIPCLKEYLRSHPGDEFYFRWSTGAVLRKMNDATWAYRQPLLDGFAKCLQHPVIRWKLLLDDFADVCDFLEWSRQGNRRVFDGYSEAVSQDRVFSEQMALRVLFEDPKRLSNYVLWAQAHLPRRHVSDLAECLYSMGPTWVARQFFKAQAGPALLRFVRDWLPASYTEVFAGRYLSDGRENELKEFVKNDPRLQENEIACMKSKDLVKFLTLRELAGM